VVIAARPGRADKDRFTVRERWCAFMSDSLFGTFSAVKYASANGNGPGAVAQCASRVDPRRTLRPTESFAVSTSVRWQPRRGRSRNGYRLAWNRPCEPHAERRPFAMSDKRRRAEWAAFRAGMRRGVRQEWDPRKKSRLVRFGCSVILTLEREGWYRIRSFVHSS
jgi:hypothetical protein